MSSYPRRSNDKDSKSSQYKTQARIFRSALNASCSVYPYTYLGSVELRGLPYAKYMHYFVRIKPEIPPEYKYERLVDVLIRAVKKIGEESAEYAGDDLRVFLNINSRKIMGNIMRRYFLKPTDLDYVTLRAEAGTLPMSADYTPGKKMPGDFRPDQIRRREVESIESLERSKK